MAEKAPLLPRSLIYRKFSYSRPFLFAFLRKILYTISVNRLRESLNGTASAIEGRPRFARELINMRESPNGMASASQADSRGFARERVSVRRPAEGTPERGFGRYPFLAPSLIKIEKTRESPNGMASASQADSRGFDSRLSLQKKNRHCACSFCICRGDPFRGFGRYPSLQSKDKGASRTLSELNQAKAKRTRSEAGISPHLHR